ncbi:hypothetical protein [Kingella sp. (in: b-proteobacteria)]|uniref:hypothetical protein n=1 Tax=Kingella sp. (in: b-proteobacteria) TaxID=2020713 RepID=UPI0026DAED03|nr:hypothetical protein [Kingella sp. (in: b-proteobacteria)]MDO4658061.1 hypothetical protein [Kingella sp. (in: b-proteobacteria)]
MERRRLVAQYLPAQGSLKIEPIHLHRFSGCLIPFTSQRQPENKLTPPTSSHPIRPPRPQSSV